MLPKTQDLKKILINQQKLFKLINKMKIKKTLLSIKFFLNCKSLNQDSKNFMKIIKLFNKRSNTFDKKVCNKYHLNLKSIKFQKKSLKPKGILLTTQFAKNTTLLRIQAKVLIDIKVPVKNQVKETQCNFRLVIKI